MNASRFISTIINNPHHYYHVSKDQIKKHGIENAIFFSALLEYQIFVNKIKGDNGGDFLSFSLTRREMASMTGMSLFKVETCIKYWKENDVLEILKKDNYKIDPENGEYYIDSEKGGF